MGNAQVANFLSHYHSHTRGHVETDAQRAQRLEALEAMPPLERSVADVLYIIDNQVGAAHPDAEVTFFAGAIQDLSKRLRAALEVEAGDLSDPEAPHAEI
jgi:hypothetical protein